MDLLVTDPVTGRNTGLARTVRKALGAMERARIPYCVVGPGQAGAAEATGCSSLTAGSPGSRTRDHGLALALGP